MKKLFVPIIIISLLVSFVTSCGSANRQVNSTASLVSDNETSESGNNREAKQSTENPVQEPSASQSKVLVAYFTRNGNTDSGFPEGVDAVARASIQQTESGVMGNAERMANWIAEASGGDLFAIQTENLYPADYDETVSQAQTEQTNGIHPALASHVENFAQFETVVLVYPNWWGDLPMPVYSFLEEYDCSGKTVIAYCTHGGSGFSNTIETIQELEPSATVIEGLAVQDSSVEDMQEEIVSSITERGLVKSVQNSTEEEQTKASTMMITIDGRSFPVELANNDTARAFIERLPMSLEMEELNGNEKYFYLDQELPAASEAVENIKAGDVMLYGADCIALFYDSFETPYSYTRIGTITDTAELQDAVGTGTVSVNFALKE